jgi:glutamate/tyrosine decarboxylase-like PLP-dependent enzyme
MEITYLYNEIQKWLNSFPKFKGDETLNVKEEEIIAVGEEFLDKMKDNYPFHHPLYAGQMLKPPHEVAIMAYLGTMLLNPNNHALDGGPATAKMEKEVVSDFAKLFGFNEYLGHLTTSGTIANFEALLIARELAPDKAVAFSEQAHYTHSRVCHWLQVPSVEIPSNNFGKIDISALEKELQKNNIGTVIVTLTTTSLGALDDLKEILNLKKDYNFRIHIDAAYGGYFKIISQYREQLQVFDLISKADSIAFDPHKQGLQPYGCGCILFNDPAVGKFYKHNSPYTYFTSDELHLGEISIECSRAGAAAAALWFTNKLFPLKSDFGIGQILTKTIDATEDFAKKINNAYFSLYLQPETNIVTYFPKFKSTAEISKASEKILKDGILQNELWVATLKVKSEHFQVNHPELIVDTKWVTILRSCLMKPEHKDWVNDIIDKLNNLIAPQKI